MKRARTAFNVLLIALMLAAGIVGCQHELSDDDIDRIAERMAAQPTEGELIQGFVDALLAHPQYQAYLEDDEWVEGFTNAVMVHPAMKAAMQTTPEEDCAIIVVMVVVAAGDYTLMPTDEEADELCSWYSGYIDGGASP